MLAAECCRRLRCALRQAIGQFRQSGDLVAGDLSTLQGDPLFAALLAAGDTASLSLLWRANQAELGARLAGYLARAQNPALSDLLLAELAQPALPVAAVRAHIMAAIGTYLPPLSPVGVAVLEADLRADGYTTLVPDAAAKIALEEWLFAHSGPVPDAYALLVIECEADTPPAATTKAATLERCRANSELRESAAAIYRAALEERGDAPSWVRATEFLEAGCDARHVGPEALDLVRTMIAVAPALATSRTFGPVFTQLIREHGKDEIIALLSKEPLGSSVGMFGLIDISDTFGRAEDRLDVFMAAYGRHPALHPVLDAVAAAWDAARWRQMLRRILRSDVRQLPDQISPLLAKAPSDLAALLVEISVARSWSEADPDLDVVVTARVFEAYRKAREAGTPLAVVLPWPKTQSAPAATYLAARLSAGGADDDVTSLVAEALMEGVISGDVAAALLPMGLSRALIERLREDGARKTLYVAMLGALLEDRLDELREAAAYLQPVGFDLDLADALAAVAPEVAFLGASDAYDGLSSVARDTLLSLLEAHAQPGQLAVVERFATSSERAERARRARAFGVAARLLPEGSAVPAYLEDGMRGAVTEVSRAAFAAVGVIGPREPSFLRSLREIANADGAGAKSAAASLDVMTTSFIADLTQPLSVPARCDVLERLGASARPAALEVLLGHLGDADLDDLVLHRTAAAAVQEAVPFLKVTSAQLERLSDLLDGDVQENDPVVRAALSNAAMIASLGADEAIALLYELARYRPTSSPDDLFGPEKGMLVRQMGLHKREADRGAAGMAYALAHLDNVAERIARAAYARLGSSESIKAQIAASAREPDYGQVLRSLGGPLDKARPGFQTLHETRSEGTEVPHPGTPMTKEAYAAALEGFRKAANVCITAIDEAMLADH